MNMTTRANTNSTNTSEHEHKHKHKHKPQSTIPKVKRKALHVAIVGPPNAGKSQLLNTITKQTISAVSRKRHTTRNGILATHTHTRKIKNKTSPSSSSSSSDNNNNDDDEEGITMEQTQLVFIDTPGFVQYNTNKEKLLFRELVRGATTHVDRADYTLIVLDAASATKLQSDETLREEIVMLMLAGQYARGRVEDVKLNEKTGEVEEVLRYEDDDSVTDSNSGDVDNGPNGNWILKSREKFGIVFNKVDLVNPKEKLLDLAEDFGFLSDTCVRYRGEEALLDSHHDAKIGSKSSNTTADSGSSGDNVQNSIDEDAYTGSSSKAMALQSIMSTKPLSSPSTTKFTEEQEEALIDQYPSIFFTSALKDDGVDDILQHLHSLATPTKEFMTLPNENTNMTLSERVEEIIREKIYRVLHREVPHNVTQVNRVFKKGRTRDGKLVLRIDQDLIVKTRSHFKLVMGRGGMTLNRIEDSAKRDLLKILKAEGYNNVILNLHVKFTKSKQVNDERRQLESERYGVMRKTF